MPDAIMPNVVNTSGPLEKLAGYSEGLYLNSD